MKKKIQVCILSLIMICSFHFLNAQSDNPPDPPGGHGTENNNPPGGGAPVGSGLLLLLGMASGYGLKKLYVNSKNKE
ncbi:MAG: hypothetical protein K9G67_10175 [Bacteroidales bacterium]|nr:hypothetical protein [Bacteroidales bacterium]MCF8343073.1 hypothetical protein [Bacteroidales bacterium]MCF8349968.1 hypothetical protein [Bacteroidales bacterium]MCF8376710.1 hypothetical protein [Bacteroidales bacterium]